MESRTGGRSSRRVPRAGYRLCALQPSGARVSDWPNQKYEDLDADDSRRNGPRFQGENFQKNLELVRRIKEIAAEKRCTPAQLALAWVLAQGEDIVPIPGTKRRKYLDENVGALDVQLSADDLRRIDEIAPKGVAAGARYPEAAMKAVNR